MTLLLLIILDVIMVSAMMLYKSYVKSLQLQLIHLEFTLKQTRKC